MLFQSAYKSLGQIVLSLITWAVLIQDWRVTIFDGHIGEYCSVFRNIEENFVVQFRRHPVKMANSEVI